MDNTSLLVALLLVSLCCLVLLVWLVWRGQSDHATRAFETIERGIRQELTESGRAGRQELGQSLTQFQLGLSEQVAQSVRTQNAQLEAFANQLSALKVHVGDTLTERLTQMNEGNARRMAEVRETLDKQIAQLQASNATKLDEMRAVVDEKLQATLEQRLGESFKQVAERLEQVHKGLGEMQTLAQGVGDLKHLLSNVKNRGMFGEAQLKSLLEQVMAPDQYAEQVMTKPGSRNQVDFAIRLPGRGDDGAPVWLPIDAKFPTEDYERLLLAQEAANPVAVAQATKELTARIKAEAKSINEKYVAPPHTTDFAMLFLPTESLYAEVLRVPGLMEGLQREHRVTLVGPTTLMAMLNSLQMGFRTLALEKRSSEVWQVLGAVKTEFGRFGSVLAKAKSQTQTVLNSIDSAETRTRAMGRALRQVEALSDSGADTLLAGNSAADTDEPPAQGPQGAP